MENCNHANIRGQCDGTQAILISGVHGRQFKMQVLNKLTRGDALLGS